jgi:putative Mn2+ efflux pump MntP
VSFRVLAFVLPLALDTFAVAAALGAAGTTGAAGRRMSAVMVGFELGMPLVGLLLGAPLGHAVGSAAEIPALVLLLLVGLQMLLGEDDDEAVAGGAATGTRVIALGLSVSLDELAIGFTLGLLRAPLVPVLLLIGAQALVAAQAGLRLGARLRERTREGAERLAGIALLVLAVVLLAERIG